MSGHTPFTDWDQRDYPGFYQPVQLDPNTFNLPVGFIDWWSPRSTLFCTCQPCLHCCNGRCNPCLVSSEDATDPQIWKQTFSVPTACPEQMAGVWWLQDNIAGETLVCMTDGYWEQLGTDHWLFRHDLPQTWTRDKSVFGYGLGIFNAWKEIWYMYRWRRVIRGDGSTTPAFEEMVRILNAPYPHRNCLQPWCPCWPCCISKQNRLKDMAFSNKQQLIIWRPEHRKATCVCYSCKIPCPCMCPLAAKVDGKYAEWVEELQGAPTQQLMPKP